MSESRSLINMFLLSMRVSTCGIHQTNNNVQHSAPLYSYSDISTNNLITKLAEWIENWRARTGWMLLRIKFFPHMIQQIEQRPVRITLPEAGVFVITATVQSSLQTVRTQLHISLLSHHPLPPLVLLSLFSHSLIPLTKSIFSLSLGTICVWPEFTSTSVCLRSEGVLPNCCMSSTIQIWEQACRVKITIHLNSNSPFWFFKVEWNSLFPLRIKDLLQKLKLKPE